MSRFLKKEFGGCFNAVGIGAVGNGIKVEIENIVFRQGMVNFDSKERFTYLAIKGAFGREEKGAS